MSYYKADIFQILTYLWIAVTREGGKCNIANSVGIGLLPDTQNRGLRMRRECRERLPRHRIQRETAS